MKANDSATDAKVIDDPACMTRFRMRTAGRERQQEEDGGQGREEEEREEEEASVDEEEVCSLRPQPSPVAHQQAKPLESSQMR